MDNYKKKEILVYIVAWGVVYLLVPITFLIEILVGHDSHFHFDDMLFVWMRMLPFLALFLIHNLIATLHSKNAALYCAMLLLLLFAFGWYCFTTGHRPPEFMPDAPKDGMRPIHPETMKLILGVLLVATNLGVKKHFELQRRDDRIHRLETENFRGQLEALRFKINPHFFMNMLNNIQALILTDPDKAMDSISGLSKVMRTVLYEGDAPVIPLAAEIEHIRNLISLMQTRFSDNLKIDTCFPDTLSEEVVPSLVFATIVENAFKHGVRESKDSFVIINLTVQDGRIRFRSTNSRFFQDSKSKSGMGLDNVKRRLDLLYGNDYSLSVNDKPEIYEILIDIPANVTIPEA